MTPDEMRALERRTAATERHYESAIWGVAAEVCERLDQLIDRRGISIMPVAEPPGEPEPATITLPREIVAQAVVCLFNVAVGETATEVNRSIARSLQQHLRIGLTGFPDTKSVHKK